MEKLVAFAETPESDATKWAREALGIIGGKPPKAAKVKKARAPKAPKRKKIARSDVRYVPVTEKHPLKLSRDEKIGGAIAAYGARAGVRRAVLTGAARIGAAAAEGSLAAGGAIVGGVAMAGILAYYLTRFVLERKDRLKITLQENAARAADAYRAARVKIASDQRRPLSAAQNKQLGRYFQDELQKLGLSKSDLSKLTTGEGID